MKNKNENALNELFDFESVVEENIINTAKRKSYIKIIAISFGISVLVLVLGVAAKLQITPHILSKKIVAIESYYNLIGANTFLGPWDEENNIFDSGATATKYKLIGKRPVYTGQVDINKINFEDHLIIEDHAIYSYYGNRVMAFYHPLVQYDNYSNDLSNMDEIGSDKNIEMALSFDKQYTLQEIENILPKDVSINWLWVDTFKGDHLKALEKYDNGISQTEAQVLSENQVIGFSTIDKTGKVKENPIEDFIEDINFGLTKGGKYKNEIKGIYESLLGDGEGIDKSNIKIIGAVVVSDKEGLNTLKDMNIIKASSFGVMSDKY